jgi:hypothetical protein
VVAAGLVGGCGVGVDEMIVGFSKRKRLKEKAGR